MNSNEYLRETLHRVSQKIHIAPDISDKKLNNAVTSFKYEGSPSNIVALYDNTVFGSGKSGLLFTGGQLIYKEDFVSPLSIKYADILNIRVNEIIKNAERGTKETQVIVVSKDSKEIVIKPFIGEVNYYALVEIISHIIESSEQFDFKEESQLVPIEQMSDLLKTAYVQCIVNMAYFNDNKIDEKELAEILVLMSRIDLNAKSRMVIRSYMADSEKLETVDSLLKMIAENEPGGQLKRIHLSLLKDLINTYISSQEITGDISIESIRDFEFLSLNRKLFNITDDDIAVILSAINADRKILNDELTDDQIVSLLKNVSSKAAAVGVPIAAVYLSGSVIGMSAAGITSGLSALGLGGLFGLSGMMTGIGVAVLLGVAAHSGVRKLTGADEISKSKKRELMLNMVIRLTQKTISQLIEDINYITKELNETMSNQDVLNEKIHKLMAYLQQLTSSGHVLNARNESVHTSVSKIRCAGYLDEEKLQQLTSEPTKKEYFDLIRNQYEEVQVKDLRDDREELITKLKLKQSINRSEAEQLAAAFEAIGYFDMTTVAKGKIVNSVKGLFGG
ncbi:MAG: hypothetical protein KH936_04585 [Neisseria sp.]|jgi:putative uncharacterized protein CPE1290|uniref:hypothetical protein n=1 Tax=Neisseria mucosa TaxID=488 RepID=UPI0018787E85|nr:hypothetical protein [Neisseria mucosa]MBS6044883.1 hypothetical protein [Neisseria sp.]MDU4437778.1 hypothetical protein [Neisseria sp.]